MSDIGLSNVDHQDVKAIKAELEKTLPVLYCNVVVLLKELKERIDNIELRLGQLESG